jgi:hypothetical protein
MNPDYFSQDCDDDPAPRRTRKPDPPLHPAAAAVAGGCMLVGSAMVAGALAFVAARTYLTLDTFFTR